MTAAFGVNDVERFRRVLAQRLGLQFDDAKFGFLGDVLRRRLDATRQDCESYLRHLGWPGATGDELGALAEELTVPETYFFRNSDQFRAFAQHVVPDRVRARAASRRLRVLSAGCASGEEAYTLAILLREAVDPSWELAIVGVDVNPTVLDRATRGRFSTWSLRETPSAVQQRWFEPDGRDVVLAEPIRRAVRFEHRNLVEDDAGLWEPETYDVVFCRNVIMYFTPESGQALVSRIARSLVPGGYLFLGHAETLRGLSHDFHLRHTHGTFYYQRKGHRLQPARYGPIRTAASTAAASPSALLSLADDADTWVDAIRMATERVHRLTESPSRTVTAIASGSTAPRRGSGLGRPLELLQQERFAEALDLVETLPAESAGAAEVVLLEAVLLAHSGQLARAEQTCRRLLGLDELSAGAHYVMALCREAAGDVEAAVDHHRVAAYLEPTFAMPLVHLGLLARRAGDLATMCRELRQAVVLLHREDASRLLLFGGGFSREALITLCLSEMRASGVRV